MVRRNVIVKFLNWLSVPFISIVALIDESRRENLDGSWDKYWARRNQKDELKALKKAYKAECKNIKSKWANYGG